MNKFDKHIKDKMSELKAEPSPEVAARIKAAAPKPGFKHFMSKNAGWFATGIVAIAGLSMLILSQNPGDNNQNAQTENTTIQSQAEKKQNKIAEQIQDTITDTIPESKNTSSVKSQPQARRIELHTYDQELRIEAQEKGQWIEKTGVHLDRKSNNHCVLTCKEKGKHKLIWHNDSGDSIMYLITFLEKPDIFTSADTNINSLACLIQCDFKSGDWKIPEGLDLYELSDSTIKLKAGEYGTYMLVRNEKDEHGRYSDSLMLNFMEPDKKIQVLQRPVCPGDHAIISMPSEYRIKCKHMQVNRLDENEYALTFTGISPNQDRCIIVNKQKDTIRKLNFTRPEIAVPDFSTKDQNCKNPGQIIIPEQHGFDKFAINGKSIKPTDTIEAGVGQHQLSWTDNRGCPGEKSIEIAFEDILQADFSIETSLDGLSARTTNKTEFEGKRYPEKMHYQWYLNGELASQSGEPELTLGEINNSIKLLVTDNQHCRDSFIMNDIRPDKSLIRAPSFFSPNNDGYFDEFKVIVDPRLNDFKGIITNRAGQQIFEWTDPENGWDGKISGNDEAGEGIYFYIIRAYDTTGRPIDKRGTVQLIRD
ncbi:MAG: gliding motility-associated C-terminal domain-containing protein [Bacteroidales bacterium]